MTGKQMQPFHAFARTRRPQARFTLIIVITETSPQFRYGYAPIFTLFDLLFSEIPSSKTLIVYFAQNYFANIRR